MVQTMKFFAILCLFAATLFDEALFFVSCNDSLEKTSFHRASLEKPALMRWQTKNRREKIPPASNHGTKKSA